MAKADPHEVMTAALILRGKIVNVSQLNANPIENATKLTQELVDSYVSKIVGGSGDSGFFVNAGNTQVPNMANLAKAISVSNHVIEQIGNAKIETVWQTGKQWASEIGKFNPDTGTIKNYNSSDVIVKIQTTGKNEATHYWGLSLKKRGIKEADPTLLNKPVMGRVGFLKQRISSAEVTTTGAAAAQETSQAAADAAAEATDAANAATDAANAAAEAADAATAAAQDAADAVAALSAQVSSMMSSLKAQLTALTNLVIKIQKKVKA
jgi:hypothetical protein